MNKNILYGTLDTLNTPLAHPAYTADLIHAIATDAANGNMESMDVLGMIFWRYGKRFSEAIYESTRSILGMDGQTVKDMHTYLWNCSSDQGSLVGALNKEETDAEALLLEHRPTLPQNTFTRLLNEEDDYDRMSPKELVTKLKWCLSHTTQGGLNQVPSALADAFAQGDAQLRYLLLHLNLLVNQSDVQAFLNGFK